MARKNEAPKRSSSGLSAANNASCCQRGGGGAGSEASDADCGWGGNSASGMPIFIIPSEGRDQVPPCNAEFHSAVSPTFSRQIAVTTNGVQQPEAMQIENLRYSRVKLCVTWKHVRQRAL